MNMQPRRRPGGDIDIRSLLYFLLERKGGRLWEDQGTTGIYRRSSVR